MHTLQKIIDFLFVKLAYAAGGSGDRISGTFDNPLGSGTTEFAQLLNRILNMVIKIGIPVLVIFIVYAGFLFVTAQGNEKKVEDAKAALFWAVIGGAVLVGAKVIASVVCSTLGVSCPGLL